MANTNTNGNEGMFVQASIPRFDGHYDHWCLLMENFLRSKEYWYLIETWIVEPAEGVVLTEVQQKKLEELKLKDLKAKNYLFQAIDRATLETILKKDTSKEIWESLKKKFQSNSRVRRANLQALRKEFESIEMKVGETVTEYIPRVMGIANKMKLHGSTMEDLEIVEKILRSLTEKYNYIICSIEESHDTEKMSMDELQSSLMVHEQKLNKNRGDEQALKVATQERSETAYGGRGRGAGSRGRGRGRGRQNKETVECYKCRKHHSLHIIFLQHPLALKFINLGYLYCPLSHLQIHHYYGPMDL